MIRKINVLQFICPSGFYGAEMWILALAKNLDPNKVSCSLVVTRESEEQNLEISKRFRALGLESIQIKMNGRFDFRAILKLSKLIKQKQIDIIHTHGYKSDILGLITAKLSGIKSVATPHGFENAPDPKLRLFIRLGCIALKQFDLVVPLSEDLESDMYRIGVKADRIRLILNGVDLQEIEEEKNKRTPSEFPDFHEKRIGYIGQMTYRKNIGDLIKTFDLLYSTHKNVRLFLIGDGPMRSELEKQTRSMRSSLKIEFLGYRKDRLSLLREMDLFSMTSSLEGIPRCMMEALAIGIPVAAYNIPGVDELIIHGETGLIAEFGDIDGLKRCWERLLFDTSYAKNISKRGRRHILMNYSAKRMAKEYISLFTELVVKTP